MWSMVHITFGNNDTIYTDMFNVYTDVQYTSEYTRNLRHVNIAFGMSTREGFLIQISRSKFAVKHSYSQVDTILTNLIHTLDFTL